MSEPQRFMHRLALALGLTLSAVEALPAAEVAAWRQFDACSGLPDVGPQWQRAAALVAATGSKKPLEDFMPVMAWSKPRGPDALLAKLKAGAI
tara:strand:- start:147 stop:425 length:279 start_codon:yes stop_codon:yes gene_type:complete